MIVLGLILILLALGAAAFAVLAPTSTTDVANMSFAGMTVEATPLGLFVSGAVAMLLLLLGLAAIARGTRRRAQTRRELKELRKQQAASPSTTRSVPSSTGSTGTTSGTRNPVSASGSTSPTGSSGTTGGGTTQPSSAPRSFGLRQDDNSSDSPPAPR